MAARPVIEIIFCRLCGWGLRAGWMAQELLATFAEEVGSVMLTPDASGGVFDVRVDGAVDLVAQGTRPLSGKQGVEAAGARPDRSGPLTGSFDSS